MPVIPAKPWGVVVAEAVLILSLFAIIGILLFAVGCDRRHGGPRALPTPTVAPSIEACPVEGQICYDALGLHPKIYKAPARGTPAKVCCDCAGTCFYDCVDGQAP